MQTAVSSRRFGFDQLRTAAVALGFTVGVATGIVAGMAIDSLPAIGGNQETVPVVVSDPVGRVVPRERSGHAVPQIVRAEPALSLDTLRFIEKNILPGDGVVTQARSLSDYRFAEINLLPGDSMAATLPSLSDYRFLDMNVLPEAQPAVTIPRGLTEYRFFEKNVHLGSDSQTILPGGERGERS